MMDSLLLLPAAFLFLLTPGLKISGIWFTGLIDLVHGVAFALPSRCSGNVQDDSSNTYVPMLSFHQIVALKCSVQEPTFPTPSQVSFLYENLLASTISVSK